MTQEWQNLLYPLGFAANFLFFLRFIYQWRLSEIKKESLVDARFWKVSLLGNCIMILHAWIQSQFGVYLIQTLNAAIAWRNLNLMGKRWTFSSVIALFTLLLLSAPFSFYLQAWIFSDGNFTWAGEPQFFKGAAASSLSLSWHLFGMVGMALFASRFWVQWWLSEMRQKSFLGKTFWWISLGGSIISSIYFIMMSDIVNFIGPLFGMVPYIRNLVLMKRQKAAI